MTDLDQPLTTLHMQAMLITLATELATRWIERVPGARDHIAAGAGVILEVTLQPEPRLELLLVDSDKSRIPLAWRDYPISTKH